MQSSKKLLRVIPGPSPRGKKLHPLSGRGRIHPTSPSSFASLLPLIPPFVQYMYLSSSHQSRNHRCIIHADSLSHAHGSRMVANELTGLQCRVTFLLTSDSALGGRCICVTSLHLQRRIRALHPMELLAHEAAACKSSDD